MAITLQLARVSTEMLEDCRRDISALDKLTSFAAVPRDHHLDLDWARAGLKILARLSGQALNAQSALYISMEGVRVINLDSPLSAIAGVWLYEIAPNEVKLIYDGLAHISIQNLLAALPDDEIDWNILFGSSELPKEFRHDYFNKHISALLEFYQKASTQSQAVVVWED
jgi:hypothetical protein